MKKKILTLLVYVLLAVAVFKGAFADEKLAIRALEEQGYSNIEITDHSWFLINVRGDCSRNDEAKFMAKATAPDGRRAEVFVCTGFFFDTATVSRRSSGQ